LLPQKGSVIANKTWSSVVNPLTALILSTSLNGKNRTVMCTPSSSKKPSHLCYFSVGQMRTFDTSNIITNEWYSMKSYCTPQYFLQSILKFTNTVGLAIYMCTLVQLLTCKSLCHAISFSIKLTFLHDRLSGIKHTRSPLCSYNNERSGILTFIMYPCLESDKIKKIVKRLVDGHLGEIAVGIPDIGICHQVPG